MKNSQSQNWSESLFKTLTEWNISLISYIPDAGNAELMKLAEANNSTETILLTTEEEGIAICAGADLVEKRGVLCMQSSGLGNCANFLSLVKGGHFPIFLIISMRGDYGEENPWQYPMGRAVSPILEAMGVLPFRVETKEDLKNASDAALSATFRAGQSSALILGQKFLGAKPF